jgi:hypothetical protein
VFPPFTSVPDSAAAFVSGPVLDLEPILGVSELRRPAGPDDWT